MEKQVALAYPTPIGRFKVPNADAVNRELRRVILEKEQSEPSSDYANVGGWHSRADLLDWPIPEVRHPPRLDHRGDQPHGRDGDRGPTDPRGVWHLGVGQRRPVRQLPSRPQPSEKRLVGRLLRRNRGQVDPKHPLAGVLELCDPRPFTEMVASPGEPFGKRVIFRPEPGMMVLFPSWIYHFVNPYQGIGERISIAFNSPWQDRARSVG